MGGGREEVVPGFAVATLKQAKRVIVAVVGGTVLLIGLALLVLPGPAFLVIPLGLGILATEFVWARRLLRRVKREASRIAASLGGGPGPARRP